MLSSNPILDENLKPLAPYLKDPSVSDIYINGPFIVYLVKNGVKFKLNKDLEVFNESFLHSISRNLAIYSNLIYDENNPYYSASLSNGERVQIISPPISENTIIAIRKFPVNNFNIESYRVVNKDKTKDSNLKYLYKNKQIYKFIEQAIRSNKNIIICGATGVGKTSFLNSCLKFFKNDERVIINQDIDEVKSINKSYLKLKTCSYLNIDFAELMKLNLRLNPDKIIIGEIRAGEVIDYINLILSGYKGTLTTVHASNCKDVFNRLSHLYISDERCKIDIKEVKSILYSLIDIIVKLERINTNFNISDVYFKDC